MKVVLVILSALALSEALKCQKTAAWTDANPELEEETCTAGVLTCTRPKYVTDKYTEKAGNMIWGCGKCTDSEASCLTCTTDNCNVKYAEFKCKNVPDGSTDAVCPDTLEEKKCYRPKVKNGAGEYFTGDWGCAPCATETNCVACTTALCNVKAATHKCNSYAKSGAVYTKGADQVDCSDDLPGCKMPTPDNAAASWDACGKCSDANDKSCAGGDDAASNDHANARYCKAGAAALDPATVKSAFCADKTSNCERPFISYGKLVEDASAYGCGDCSASGKEGKCVKCDTAANDCNKNLKTGTTVSCFAWSKSDDKWTVGSKKNCEQNDNTIAKCSRPASIAVLEKDDYDGDGCGPCTGKKSCQDFAKDLNVAGTHSCYQWKWDEDKSKYLVSAVVEQCDKADKKCNMPKDASKKDAYKGSGCEACATDDAGCLTTAEGKNNWGHRATISLLAVVLPLLYTML